MIILRLNHRKKEGTGNIHAENQGQKEPEYPGKNLTKRRIVIKIRNFIKSFLVNLIYQSKKSLLIIWKPFVQKIYDLLNSEEFQSIYWAPIGDHFIIHRDHFEVFQNLIIIKYYNF